MRKLLAGLALAGAAALGAVGTSGAQAGQTPAPATAMHHDQATMNAMHDAMHADMPADMQGACDTMHAAMQGHMGGMMAGGGMMGR